jgi:hypothetical protein
MTLKARCLTVPDVEFNAYLEARRAARQALEASIGDIISVSREAFNITEKVRVAAEAQPQVQLVRGLVDQINTLTETVTKINDVIAMLEPHSSIPSVSALLGFFRAALPIITGYTAAKTASLVTLATVIPDPTSLGIAALGSGVALIQGSFDSGIAALLNLIDGEDQ